MVGSDSITLEYKMKKGEELRYKTTVESEQSVQEGDNKAERKTLLEMVMLQRCTEVTADGTLGVDVIIESGFLKSEGEQEELPDKGKTISMKMKKNGEIVQTNVDLPFSQPPFPSNAIKKKEKWTGESKVQIPTEPPKTITLTYNYILWDLAKVEGHECVEIKVSCPECTIDLGKDEQGKEIKQILSATGTTYFAHKEGMLIKSEVETKTDITASNAAVKTHIKVKVELTEHKKAGAGVEPQEGFHIAGT